VNALLGGSRRQGASHLRGLSTAVMSPNTTSIFPERINFFSKMESAAPIHPTAPLVPRSGHLSYYIALACILLAYYIFRVSRHPLHPNIPFYKASKTKWIFDAETLVRDSYNKVCRFATAQTQARLDLVQNPLTPTD
jgi:hypothetical protein